MARSRRRTRRGRPKVRVGVRKAKRAAGSKTHPVPALAQGLSQRQQALLEHTTQARVVWDTKSKLAHNYKASGILPFPNVGFGRNRAEGMLVNAEDTSIEVSTTGRCDTRSTTLPRPTPRMRQTVQQLTAVYGDNIDAMVRDRKLNRMQHSRGKLVKMIQACKFLEL